MELNQVSYFINLAETLNFTAAARLSGVSQPSLTRAIRRLEEELGGPLIYRDGKNSRLTTLGQDVSMEFRRMQVALRNVRQHSDNWTLGRRRVLDIAVFKRKRASTSRSSPMSSMCNGTASTILPCQFGGSLGPSNI